MMIFFKYNLAKFERNTLNKIIARVRRGDVLESKDNEKA